MGWLFLYDGNVQGSEQTGWGQGEKPMLSGRSGHSITPWLVSQGLPAPPGPRFSGSPGSRGLLVPQGGRERERARVSSRDE